MSDEDKVEELVEIEISDNPMYCYACGESMQDNFILICAECLDDECSDFLKETSK